MIELRSTRTMNIKVAIIDNSLNSSIYNPVAHWSSHLTCDWKSFKAKENQFPDLKKEFTHVILTGSEASIVERERWVEEEVCIAQEAVERGLSVLGSCYGHQLLALALGGESCVRRSKHPEVGWDVIQITKTNGLLGKKREFYCYLLHFDEVTNLGKKFTILASSKKCDVQAFQWKNRPVWGIQAHPEISTASGKSLLKNLIALQLKTNQFFKRGLKTTPRDSGLINLIIRNFVSSIDFPYKKNFFAK